MHFFYKHGGQGTLRFTHFCVNLNATNIFIVVSLAPYILCYKQGVAGCVCVCVRAGVCACGCVSDVNVKKTTLKCVIDNPIRTLAICQHHEFQSAAWNVQLPLISQRTERLLWTIHDYSNTACERYLANCMTYDAFDNDPRFGTLPPAAITFSPNIEQPHFVNLNP